MKRACALAAGLVAGLAQAFAGVEIKTSIAKSGDVEVPVEIALPEGRGPFPPVLYIHAKRGYDEVDRRHITALAEQGFLVVAPDWQSGRFIERWPKAHDPATENDVEAAFDLLLKHPQGCKVAAGMVGYSRGGYYALRLAAKRGKDIAAVATYAGHMQNPNAPEGDQLFNVAPEVSQVTTPWLFVIGEQDYELRRMVGGRAFYALYERGIPVEVQYYPLARRAFDFRNDQTPEEKVAAKHARERVRDWFGRWMKLDEKGRCR